MEENYCKIETDGTWGGGECSTHIGGRGWEGGKATPWRKKGSVFGSLIAVRLDKPHIEGWEGESRSSEKT